MTRHHYVCPLCDTWDGPLYVTWRGPDRPELEGGEYFNWWAGLGGWVVESTANQPDLSDELLKLHCAECHFPYAIEELLLVVLTLPVWSGEKEPRAVLFADRARAMEVML